MGFTVAISEDRTPIHKNPWTLTFIAGFLAVWANSLFATTNVANWFLENALVFVFLGFMVWAYTRYQFSDFTYLLICVFLSLHVYGAKHTYALNPFGFWLQEVTGASRNHYDRIVHFSFGFLLAYPMREMFLKWLKFPSWVAWLLPIEITLSVSGAYELVEWGVADVFFPEQGSDFLGTQGDEWDAQKDMFLAFSGAILSTSIISLFKYTFKIYEKPEEGVSHKEVAKTAEEDKNE